MILLLACAFAIFFELGQSDVVSDNEGQRATPPAEMLRTGDYLVPRINGVDYLSKPPLLYWATAGIYLLTGTINEWTARLSTALSATCFVLCAFLLFRRWQGNMTALLSALALLTAPYVLERSRVAELDVPLSWMSFLCIMALHAFWRHARFDRTGWSLIAGGGVALGAAILLKGPVPLLFVWPAWLAFQLAETTSERPLVRRGVKLTLLAFLVECVLKGAAALVRDHIKDGKADMTSEAVKQWTAIEHTLGYPVALILVLVVWTWLAWVAQPARRGTRLAGLLACVAIGIAVALPWGLAVLNRLGWEYIQDLLNNQVVKRTYTASEINSGSPFYYVLGLPVMLLPWGFLLPLHFSRIQWSTGTPHYRFCVLAGWISVSIYSLIAGKEYEYILPAVPFLLAAVAETILAMRRREDQTWTIVLYNVWQSSMLLLFGMVAIAGPIYLIANTQPVGLVILATCVGISAVFLLLFGRRIFPHRSFSIAAACVLLVSTAWIAQKSQNTGHESYKTIATKTGDMLRAGNTVETQRMAPYHVLPAFAFYAAIPVPLCTDVMKAVAKINGADAYYYVIRQEVWDAIKHHVPEQHRAPLMGPYTNKDVILVGNRPLP